MYWWNIKELKKTLATTGLSQKSCFLYALIMSVLYAVMWDISIYLNFSETVSIWTYIESLGTLVITVVGFYAFYKANGGNEGKALLERNMSIGFVVLIRTLPLLLALMIALAVYYWNIEEEEVSASDTAVDTATILFYEAFIFYRMVVHVRDVANTK